MQLLVYLGLVAVTSGARVNMMEYLNESDAVGIDDLAKTKCKYVSRRRVFSTTCACRRRTVVEPEDYGLECVNNLMRCPVGVWDSASMSCSLPDADTDEGGTTDEVLPAATTPAPASAIIHKPQPVAVAAAASPTNPVIEVFMYRAQEYEGASSQYMLENVDMADLPGVLQYIHREIITEHQIASVERETGQQRMARKYDISTILEYRFLIRNPDSQSRIQQDFHGYETYDFGQASNTAQWLELSHSDHVGVQRQSNKFVPFRDPYYWFSVSGFCPNLPYSSAAITSVCKENPLTLAGTCTAKAEAMSRTCAVGNADLSKCLCYSDGASVVWGGLCGATADRQPPKSLEVPTGQRGCVYSYDPNPNTVNLDELVGITKEDCGGRLCTDYADFRKNCAETKYKKTFTALGRISNSPVCVEYDLHPDCAQMGCDHPTCKRIPQEKRELGLPFWLGRCSSKSNAARAEKAAAMFGVQGATTQHVITHPPTVDYAGVKCDRGKNLECRPNRFTGEGFCTRAWSGICTSCRIPGFKRNPLNRQTPLCPWSVLEEYTNLKSDSCRTTNAADICCIYFGSCAQAGGLEDSFALSLASKDTATISTFLRTFATETLEVSEQEVQAADEALTQAAYWYWGAGPDPEIVDTDTFSLRLAADWLSELFPSAKKYDPPTTTTTTTTRRVPRRFVPLTTSKRFVVADAGEMPMQCQCAMEPTVKGIHTNRPGCKQHMGRQFGNFCYMEGGRECPGAKFSRKLNLYYRRCNPELDQGAP